jgi:hypothetical protein
MEAGASIRQTVPPTIKYAIFCDCVAMAIRVKRVISPIATSVKAMTATVTLIAAAEVDRI